eukprot:04482.XXX_63884_63628_1 [CDS] Oithona nana genome sequencing.
MRYSQIVSDYQISRLPFMHILKRINHHAKFLRSYCNNTLFPLVFQNPRQKDRQNYSFSYQD